jgi:DNA-directed RNA polymerase specialized sigma24 family protein
MPSSNPAGLPGGVGARFETTQWSLVLAAGQGTPGSPTAEQALARLCALYWYPVFAFVRRKGHAPEDAQDLTQGFFARLIEKGDLGDADRSRGRFRTFLLTACQHHLANEHDRDRAQKRGGGIVPVPIDAAVAERRYERAFAHDETPERVYDRQWCLTLLDGVFEALRNEYASNGKAELFDRLKDFVNADEDAGTHADAARELGTTAGAVKVAVHRMRRRFREELLRRVADTLDPGQDVDDEIRCLLATLGPPRSGA